MASASFHFYSEKLTDSTTLHITVPADTEQIHSGKCPVLLLFPPLGMDYTQWQRHIDLDTLSADHGFLIVCPDLRLSLGLNMAHGLSFFDMLSKEIPRVLQTYFNADPAVQILCGYEEGAYTAGYLALRRPDRYRKAVMISCGSLTDEDIRGDKRYENIFGDALYSDSLEEFDLKKMLQKSRKSVPISLYYGRQDKFASSARLLAENSASPGLKATVSGHMLRWSDCFEILKKEL